MSLLLYHLHERHFKISKWTLVKEQNIFFNLCNFVVSNCLWIGTCDACIYHASTIIVYFWIKNLDIYCCPASIYLNTIIYKAWNTLWQFYWNMYRAAVWFEAILYSSTKVEYELVLRFSFQKSNVIRSQSIHAGDVRMHFFPFCHETNVSSQTFLDNNNHYIKFNCLHPGQQI